VTPSGHCLCGAVRYKFDPDAVLWRGHCHCASCRRATGAPVVTWFGVRASAWRWFGAAPAVFASGPGTERLFCATCGTPMAYRSAQAPNEIHGLAATLDDPADFAPEAHYHWEERLPWLELGDALPRYRGPDHAAES